MAYDGVIIKPPLDEDTLAHYGVKGMKWGRRKKKMILGDRGNGQMDWGDKKRNRRSKYLESTKVDIDQNGNLTVMKRKGRLVKGYPGNIIEREIVSGGSGHTTAASVRGRKRRKKK